jgi:hypothetical protein
MAARRIRTGLCVLALAALAACAVPPGSVRPPPRRPFTPTPAPPSAESVALRAYYARVERDLVAQGLLRQDGGGEDTPFTARMLAENFIRIALYDEYVARGGRLVQTTTESRLRRWERPIRMRLIFGQSVPEARQAADRANVGAYTQRLSRLTRVPIRVTEQSPNFELLVMNEDERRAAGPLVRSLVPGISETAVRTVTDMPRSTFCLVFAFSEGESASYTRAVAVIRAEHPDLLRLSCIHEELAQAMGLANDSPTARPSIFNDDEEFGLLTRQDELMLRILYDPRLKPGMTAAEARPIVETIAAELVGGES